DGDLDGVTRGLRGGDRLQRGAVHLALALFGHHENHSALASSRSRFTSSLAASAGVPGRSCVLLPFSGKFRLVTRGPPEAAGAAPFLISFFFAAMMPFSVA